MKTLSRLLTGTLRPTQRAPDLHRAARKEAKALAERHAITIERIDGGMNVWPPKTFSGQDPWEGDHYCLDWAETRKMVRTYAGLDSAPASELQS